MQFTPTNPPEINSYVGVDDENTKRWLVIHIHGAWVWVYNVDTDRHNVQQLSRIWQ